MAEIVIAEQVTFNASRDPMFTDDRGNGWVPLARFMELHDALAGLVLAGSLGPGVEMHVRHALGGDWLNASTERDS